MSQSIFFKTGMAATASTQPRRSAHSCPRTRCRPTTGLPIWYETVPGNVVDVPAVGNVMEELRPCVRRVVYVSGDAGHCRPADVERLAPSGTGFLARTDPTHASHRHVLEEHFAELDDPANVVRHRGRRVWVEAVVATDAGTGGEVRGLVYPCRDA